MFFFVNVILRIWMKNSEVLAYIKVTRVFMLSEINLALLYILYL